MDNEPASSRRSLTERREQLLDAAIDVMSDRGITGATTRAITERAGVPHGVFHYCFDSKTALLRALLARESERALSPAWRLDPDSDGLTEALSTAIHGQLARVRAEPKQFLVLAELTVIARTDPALTDLALWERTQYLDLITQLLGKWKTDTPPADLHHWAAVILAGIDGLIDGWLTTRDDETTDAAASLFAASVGAAAQAR
ncbi:TetR/AcrR family transcriptional regulator [Amycolatopsis sp.]|uniref:TetR/AcrR family transcriptional regulator n=1 Tax=Amycolatopsis sp. TaxID=37632 RepID=UPI002D7FEB28|nr:TetR/AcrR family transcriptional regulator [Amycolatopsis sp.]HET6704699.1 TetR/AcrR family transcriptional regulator [Amycolatopsis sp.]